MDVSTVVQALVTAMETKILFESMIGRGLTACQELKSVVQSDLILPVVPKYYDYF